MTHFSKGSVTKCCTEPCWGGRKAYTAWMPSYNLGKTFRSNEKQLMEKK